MVSDQLSTLGRILGSEPEPGQFHPGGHYDDPELPESSPTIGYRLNHFMLRIRDPQKTLHFYIDLMGMRTVFTMNTGPFTIYYLGFPRTEADRADLKQWSRSTASFETIVQTPGLLELKHIHGSERSAEQGGYEISNGNTAPALGFGHLGFTVPDVQATVARLRAAGVTVVKELGYSGRDSIPLTEWEKGRGVGTEEMVDSYKKTLEKVACVIDPNGYIVELVPQRLN
ncbi:hypothetical protein F66182_4916 [Fusarium sp. NRRL 66182]|nr:hypothetical protein F66182_4916 [Fusarium sp. NRRL 66182]